MANSAYFFNSFIVVYLLAAFLSSVNAHGYISDPLADNLDTKYDVAKNGAEVNSEFAQLKLNGSPEENARSFWTGYQKAQYKSLKELMDEYVEDWVHNKKDSPAVSVTGKTELHWQNDNDKAGRVGFVESHRGPCEVWIKDSAGADHLVSDPLAESYDGKPGYDCAGRFGTASPAKIPVNYSACNGECVLTFYWLALHEQNWQFYKQMVNIKNDGSGTGQVTESKTVENNNPGTETEKTPSPKTTETDYAKPSCKPKRRYLR